MHIIFSVGYIVLLVILVWPDTSVLEQGVIACSTGAYNASDNALR